MRPVLLLLLLAGCGRARDDVAGSRRTLMVAYGADEFPLALNRERLGRYPLNAGICEPNGVRFVLRSGVTFSDGRPFDARAVAYTLAGAARTRTDYSFLSDTSVRVVDDTTLDVRPERVNRRLVDQLVHPTYDILETALHRLSSHEALGIVRGAAERERIRTATRRAVSALLCGSSLAPGDARTLADSFLTLL